MVRALQQTRGAEDAIVQEREPEAMGTKAGPTIGAKAKGTDIRTEPPNEEAPPAGMAKPAVPQIIIKSEFPPAEKMRAQRRRAPTTARVRRYRE